jgi:hypothetical protein
MTGWMPGNGGLTPHGCFKLRKLGHGSSSEAGCHLAHVEADDEEDEADAGLHAGDDRGDTLLDSCPECDALVVARGGTMWAGGAWHAPITLPS